MRFRNLAVVAIAFVFGGCASVPAGKSVVGDMSAKPDASDVEFWHTLQMRPLATNDDAFHGLLIYLDGSDYSTDYPARVSALKQRGMLPPNFKGQADEAIERGTLAVALVKALNLKGGLTMHLFGASPRYAVRELVYRRIYPESSESQLFSGADFLGVMGRVEDFKEGDPANYPAKVLYVGAPETPPPSEDALQDEVSYPAFLSTAAMANFSLLQPSSEPSSAPATQAAPLKLPEGPLKLIITGVRGKAEVHIPPADWTKAQPNVELSEGAEVRTGLNAAIQLQIRPDQTITIDRLSKVTIDRATLAKGKFVTSVSMPYGRTRYDIDAANREYDATVRSPNSTLGIRGTRVSLLDQRPFPPEAVSLTGTAQFRNIRRQLVALGARGQGKTKIVGGQANAAEYALDEAVIDPTLSGARTQSEEPLIASLISRGAVVEFNRELGIPIVSGGTVPRTDRELIPLLPGNLDFVIRWNTDVDFNIAVFTPPTDANNQQGEVLFPAPGLVQVPSGGKIPFDHRGGPNGGIELAHWDTAAYPRGTYAVAALNQSTKSARVRVESFVNHRRYNNENSDLGFTDLNLEINPGAKLVNNGYELDVAPGLVAALFYDVEDPSGTATPQASSAKNTKAVKKKPPTFVGPIAPARATKTIKR
jgi:hypothetical protein